MDLLIDLLPYSMSMTILADEGGVCVLGNTTIKVCYFVHIYTHIRYDVELPYCSNTIKAL